MNGSNIQIESFEDPSFGENAYVVSTGTEDERVGWVIDPSFPPTVHELLDYVDDQKICIERILLTHGHIDHIAGVDEVKGRHPQARLGIAQEEQAFLNTPDLNLSSMMGLAFSLATPADDDLPAGGALTLSSVPWRILDVSGHSPAGRAFYCPTARIVLVGDAIMAGSIGRYDFPGSDGSRLLRNIRLQLLQLPAETTVYSGHGPPTTIGNERKFNPFLAE